MKTPLMAMLVMSLVTSGIARAEDDANTKETTTETTTTENTTTNNNAVSEYIGVLAGGIGATSQGAGTNPSFGLTLGGKVIPGFGLGIVGSYYQQTSSGTLLGLPDSASIDTVILAAEANIFIGGLHLGGDIGGARSSWSGYNSPVHNGTSTTDLVYGPEAGYDFVIARTVSLGLEGRYLITTASNGVNNVQVVGALKFWQ